MPTAPTVLDRAGPPSQHASTAAVIVTYDGRGATACAGVTAAFAAGAGHVVVVLNGEHARTRSEVQAALAPLGDAGSTVQLARNTGSAGGYAAGMEHALALDGVQRLWLLDDDNRPDAGALRRAAARMTASEAKHGVGHVAVACARPSDRAHGRLLRGEDAEDVFAADGSFLHFDVRRRMPFARAHRRVRARRSEVLLPAAPYGGLLISTSLVHAVGVPRADFVLYEDDIEYTDRITHAGGRIVFAPDAVVGDADKDASPPEPRGERPLVTMLRCRPEDRHRLYYQYRNRSYLDVRRARGPWLRLVLAVNLGGYLVAVLGFAIADRRNRAGLPTFARAVRDGLRGALGPTFRL